MPLGEPWRVGKRPYGRSALSAAAACLKGFYLHQFSAGELDWSRACVDGFHVRPEQGGADTGPSPVDRRETGSEHHLIATDAAPRYDSNAHRDEPRQLRILPVISRKGSPDIKSMGKLRYAVEQPFALLHQFRRLAVRWERRTELHDAFVSLACSLICWRRLRKAHSRSGPK